MASLLLNLLSQCSSTRRQSKPNYNEKNPGSWKLWSREIAGRDSGESRQDACPKRLLAEMPLSSTTPTASPELTQEIAAEQGITVDVAGFEAEMEQHAAALSQRTKPSI